MLLKWFTTPAFIGVLYLCVLIVFACIYFFMPVGSFYHATIQHEPAAVQHRSAFEAAVDKDLSIDRFNVGPQQLFTVNSNGSHDFEYHPTYITFRRSYYYYNMNKEGDELAALVRMCGKSDNPRFFTRTVDLAFTMAASISRTRTSVRAKSNESLTECDQDILRLIYQSFEKTDGGFQAMIDTSSDTQNLLVAVSEEQLGGSPREFWFDRATRMLYFSEPRSPQRVLGMCCR